MKPALLGHHALETVADGEIRIGAIIRFREFKTHAGVDEARPLIAQARGA